MGQGPMNVFVDLETVAEGEAGKKRNSKKFNGVQVLERT